jgi:hypothetical protein
MYDHYTTKPEVLQAEEDCLRAYFDTLTAKHGLRYVCEVAHGFAQGLSLEEAERDADELLAGRDLRETQACVRYGGA